MTTQTELAKDLRSLLCANADFYSNGGESLPQAAYDAQVGVKEGAFLLKWGRALAASAEDARLAQFRALLNTEVHSAIDVSGNVSHQEGGIDMADHLTAKFDELFPETSHVRT